MDRKELNKIRKAARNMKNENHTFYIEGKNFSCVWDGKSFTWMKIAPQKKLFLGLQTENILKVIAMIM